MNRLFTVLVGLLLLTACTFSFEAEAEENNKELPTPNKLLLPITVECDRYEVMAEVIFNKFDEQPFVQAQGLIFNGGQYRPVELEIFVNQTTGTFSIIFDGPGEFSCMLFPGGEFRPHELLLGKGEKTKIRFTADK